MMRERCLRPFICPICQQPLHRSGGGARCPQNHTFDFAREGYLHLLPGGGKRPKFLGDSTDMVQARRRFLDTGLYEPLRMRLQTIAKQCVETINEPVVVEMGCGEGYYVGGLAEQWPSAGCFVGVDVAKEAVRLAARRYQGVQFAVADVKRPLPLTPACAHLLLNIFAPRQPASFAQLLAPGGWLLVVIPQDNHLATVREQLGLLTIETDKEAKVVAQFTPWLRLVRRETVSFALTLTANTLADLVLMSPNARHLDEGQRAALATLPLHSSEASLTLLLFQRS